MPQTSWTDGTLFPYTQWIKGMYINELRSAVNKNETNIDDLYSKIEALTQRVSSLEATVAALSNR